MALEEELVVRVVGRGGGIGWAIVEQDGGGHALVPESYLELNLFFVTYFFCFPQHLLVSFFCHSCFRRIGSSLKSLPPCFKIIVS